MRLQFVLREVHTADCPVEEETQSILELRHKTMCPSLLMTMGSKIVEDSATTLTQTAVFISFIFSLLDLRNLASKLCIRLLKHPCKKKDSNKSAVSGGLATV